MEQRNPSGLWQAVGVPESLTDALDRVRAALLDADRLHRAVASGRQRGRDVPWRRAEARYVELKSGTALQVTTYDEARARTRNAAPGPEAATIIDELLNAGFGNWHVETAGETLQLRVTKKGRAQLHARPSESDRPVSRDHDRVKPRLLPAGDPVLRAIGLTDPEGRVKPSRQAKYRQVDEFLRILQPAIDDGIRSGRLPEPSSTRPLRMVDLGCGNAYLTFSAVAYLSGVRELESIMTGVELRPAARRRNTELAGSVGFDTRMTFVESSIAEVSLPEPPDVVLSLHACDTATDEALARAVRWRAPVILAAPCCHHDLQTQLDRSGAPDPYRILTRHSVLTERFADALTDAFRASLLRQHGYRVDVIEFVGSEHTPRNIMLRAARTGAEPDASIRAEYATMTRQWGVRPALARMLDADPPAV